MFGVTCLNECSNWIVLVGCIWPAFWCEHLRRKGQIVRWMIGEGHVFLPIATKAMIMTLPAAQVPAGLEAFDSGSGFEGWQGSLTRSLPPVSAVQEGMQIMLGGPSQKIPGPKPQSLRRLWELAVIYWPNNRYAIYISICIWPLDLSHAAYGCKWHFYSLFTSIFLQVLAIPHLRKVKQAWLSKFSPFQHAKVLSWLQIVGSGRFLLMARWCWTWIILWLERTEDFLHVEVSLFYIEA